MDLSAIRCHLVGFFKTFIEKVKRILDRFSFTPKACVLILTFYLLLVLVTLLVGWIGLLEYETIDYILAGATGVMLGLIYFLIVMEIIPMGHDNLKWLIGVIGITLSWSFWRKWLSAELLSALKRQAIWFHQSICQDRNTLMLLEHLSYNYPVPLDPWNDEENIYDVGGLSEASIANIPKITITSNNNVDSTSGERDLCSICLQYFEVGEIVRSLPGCHHIFHIPCIDEWLTMNGSCPLCRRELL